MTRITHIVKLAVFAVLVGVAAFMAGSAQAATIDHDTVSTIGSDSFKFTGGDVYWHFSNGRIDAHLLGTLKLNDANGSCARMRMEYFHDGTSLIVKTGGIVCAPDGKAHDYDVDLNKYSNADIDLLKVSVEKQTASSGGSFSIVESAYFSPSTAPDTVRITEDGVDFGGDEFSSVTAQPVGSGTLYWNREDGANFRPRLMGSFWLNNSAGLCARMNLVYYTESGSYITEKPGGVKCAPDNDPFGVGVDLAPYSSTQVGKVKVELQTQGTNGSWNVVGSETVTIDE